MSSEHKERVVRETVSFSRPQSPMVMKPVPSYTPAPAPTTTTTRTEKKKGVAMMDVMRDARMLRVDVVVGVVFGVIPPPSFCHLPDNDDEDDGYGDDFEDYDDDFDFEEEDESSEVAPSSRHSSTGSSVPKLSFSNPKEDAEMKQIRQSMEVENSQAISRQHNRWARQNRAGGAT